MDLYVITICKTEAAKSRSTRREAIRSWFGRSKDDRFAQVGGALPWHSLILPARNDKDAKARAKSMLNGVGTGNVAYLAKLEKVATFQPSINETPADANLLSGSCMASYDDELVEDLGW